MNGHPDSLARGPLAWLIRASMHTPVVVLTLTCLLIFLGLRSAPFDWALFGDVSNTVAADALPDTSENQQIVTATWPGRSPRDVENQVTYPLTVALLGVPGVRSIRSSSMFGLSSVTVVFEEHIEFYWARSRILEKLASLDSAQLPTGVRPQLGPDATALGQVFWYTLEAWSLPEGEREAEHLGGFDSYELRSIQDWQVKLALATVPGVAEVASIGGHVREFQVEVDPGALRVHQVTLEDVVRAVSQSNLDVGARTIELNRVEYLVRGLGFLESIEDLHKVVVRAEGGVPVTLDRVANLALGPAPRRGVLDKGGHEAVGGVVVARFGANPREVLEGVHDKLREIEDGLPTRTLDDGTRVRVRVVPFYDRSELIEETLGTLEQALSLQALVTALVILTLMAHLRSVVMVTGLLPLAVLLTFVAMRTFDVGANIVALSGIAIAIGTLVDMGIVLVENMVSSARGVKGRKARIEAMARGASEVGGAVLTSVATTVVGFLPVFAMHGAEGKLFTPLATTKTFALVASIVLALTVLPAWAAAWLARDEAIEAETKGTRKRWLHALLLVCGTIGVALVWQPLGPRNVFGNLLATGLLLGVPMLCFAALLSSYEHILRWCLEHKALFLCAPSGLIVAGATAWLGFEKTFGWLPDGLEQSRPTAAVADLFPGLGREFLPRLDEGAFLLMPVVMAHASIGEALEILQAQDRAIRAIPEVDQVIGKLGRVDSALDPAPISMIETLVSYLPEYRRAEAMALSSTATARPPFRRWFIGSPWM